MPVILPLMMPYKTRLQSGASVQIKWLRTALSNLDHEATYIAQENPQAARVVVARIYEQLALLAENPSLGKAGRVQGTRELVIPRTRYIIPYRVRNHTIEILRVFHTSRRLPKRW